MNVVPGGSFFQTVSGSAAHPDPAQRTRGAAQLLEAQAVDSRDAGRVGRADSPAAARSTAWGPRGRLIDILA